MKKFSFYIATAFLAFGFGVSIVYFAVFKRENNVAIMPIVQTTYGNFRQQPFSADHPTFYSVEPWRNVTPREKIGCKNKLYLKIKKSYLSSDNLESEEELRDYTDYFETTDCKDIFRTEKVIDLNNDGKKEIIIRGIEGSFLCGGTGNCGEWIFEKIGKDYRQLLNASALSLTVKKEKTRNYNDIFTKGHFSAAETYETTYKFNGKKYIESNCNFVAYSSEDKKSVMTCKEKDKEFQKP
jgi:hypothetical protein